MLAAIVVLLFALAFGPVDVRLQVERPLRFELSVLYFGLRLPVGRSRRAPPKRGQRKRRGRGGLSALLRVRQGRALLEVARASGVVRFAWETAEDALRLVRVVRADWVVFLGRKGPGRAWIIGALALAQPRFVLGRRRVRLEIQPDVTGLGLGLEGELLLRTRPAYLIAFGVRLICSPIARRAWRIWRKETRAAS